MFARFRHRFTRAKRARLLRRTRIGYSTWHDACRRLPVLGYLDREQRPRLRRLAGLFLAEKTMVGAGDQALDEHLCTAIAAQACLPILELGLEAYGGWRTVIVYPDTFLVDHREVDDAGVLHESRQELAGEAWEQGPVILSWGDIARAGPGGDLDGGIIIHEVAHKLDMLSGGPNGMPPLHRGMDPAAWTEAFSAAYEALRDAVAAGEATAIDPYAAESPGEFFAVLSEAFFETPARLQASFPRVYAQLALFYRQDPAAADH
ncbi:Inner membrane protein [Pseudohaliea rubra DSM 19751]|uniref:Inner membrane protein n=2 Tax=Pseudohaliea TaxID=1341120 RepID=A0A095VMQ5_9GAMM|nr:Inner membrane protein [Pseudohaliea rubra DSM 19751]